jgi:hypothetical protein
MLYCNRSAAQLKAGNHEQAVNDAKRSAKIDGTYAKAYARLGHAYHAKGSLIPAAQAFKKAMILEPKNKAFKSNLDALEKVKQHARSNISNMFYVVFPVAVIIRLVSSMKPDTSSLPSRFLGVPSNELGLSDWYLFQVAYRYGSEDASFGMFNTWYPISEELATLTRRYLVSVLGVSNFACWGVCHMAVPRDWHAMRTVSMVSWRGLLGGHLYTMLTSAFCNPTIAELVCNQAITLLVIDDTLIAKVAFDNLLVVYLLGAFCYSVLMAMWCRNKPADQAAFSGTSGGLDAVMAYHTVVAPKYQLEVVGGMMSPTPAQLFLCLLAFDLFSQGERPADKATNKATATAIAATPNTQNGSRSSTSSSSSTSNNISSNSSNNSSNSSSNSRSLSRMAHAWSFMAGLLCAAMFERRTLSQAAVNVMISMGGSLY